MHSFQMLSKCFYSFSYTCDLESLVLAQLIISVGAASLHHILLQLLSALMYTPLPPIKTIILHQICHLNSSIQNDGLHNYD